MAKAAACIKDTARIREMEKNSLAMALPDASDAIVREIYKVIQ